MSRRSRSVSKRKKRRSIKRLQAKRSRKSNRHSEREATIVSKASGSPASETGNR
jgi:hypothetical protein